MHGFSYAFGQVQCANMGLGQTHYKKYFNHLSMVAPQESIFVDTRINICGHKAVPKNFIELLVFGRTVVLDEGFHFTCITELELNPRHPKVFKSVSSGLKFLSFLPLKNFNFFLLIYQELVVRQIKFQIPHTQMSTKNHFMNKEN